MMLTRSGVLQTIVEKERLKTKVLVEEAKREAQREAAERERELEERTAKLLEEERNRNDSANRALYELIVVRFSCILIIPIMHVMFALLSNMTDS